MKNTLAYILAGMALSPFALTAAFADHHERHSASGMVETKKELRANTTGPEEMNKLAPGTQKIDRKKHVSTNTTKKKIMKPLKNSEQKEMETRENLTEPQTDPIPPTPN